MFENEYCIDIHSGPCDSTAYICRLVVVFVGTSSSVPGAPAGFCLQWCSVLRNGILISACLSAAFGHDCDLDTFGPFQHEVPCAGEQRQQTPRRHYVGLC